ncbi:hypothetical protein HC341_10710 [Aquisalimonas sp. 2447]|uniref:hypothetical protein n=1 Tax=Aquisalimonas sp. 2447 TaxID=2740807 RepID=UPI00143240F0|nr:hypothetical protein [Aquisalimonas sp. 2447]QIT55637.1 hypothetical protein HC341_10710 [Aquisalimonas sp. 2447]
MRRTLLVAEGTFKRPLLEICITALGMSMTLLVGFFILNLGLPGWLTLVLIVALLVGVALLKGRYSGPREFRIERPADSPTLQLTGRFDDGELPVKSPQQLLGVVHDDDALVFHTRTADGRLKDFRIGRPAFSRAGMDTLISLTGEFPDVPQESLEQRYKDGRDGIKAYPARNLLLLRYAQSPNYMTLTWGTAFVVLIVWILVLGAVVGA